MCLVVEYCYTIIDSVTPTFDLPLYIYWNIFYKKIGQFFYKKYNICQSILRYNIFALPVYTRTYANIVYFHILYIYMLIYILYACNYNKVTVEKYWNNKISNYITFNRIH